MPTPKWARKLQTWDLKCNIPELCLSFWYSFVVLQMSSDALRLTGLWIECALTPEWRGKPEIWYLKYNTPMLFCSFWYSFVFLQWLHVRSALVCGEPCTPKWPHKLHIWDLQNKISVRFYSSWQSSRRQTTAEKQTMLHAPLWNLKCSETWNAFWHVLCSGNIFKCAFPYITINVQHQAAISDAISASHSKSLAPPSGHRSSKDFFYVQYTLAICSFVSLSSQYCFTTLIER